MMTGVVAIVEYRMSSDRADDFCDLIRSKQRYQEDAGFIHPDSRLARIENPDEDSLFVEIFTWIDQAAISRAHQDAAMDAWWNQLDEVTLGGRWEGIRILNGTWI